MYSKMIQMLVKQIILIISKNDGMQRPIQAK